MSQRGYGQIMVNDEIQNVWSELVGKQLANMSRVGRIRQGVLDVFVANSMNPEIDEARQTELRNVLAKYTFPGHKPNVAGAFFLPHHAVGSEQSVLRDTYLSSQRAPTLESVSGNISGSAQ